MELRAQASWLLAKQVVSRPALLDAAALEPWAVAVVWLGVARQQVVVPEAEPVWAAWVAAEPVRLAEAVPALVVVELSRGLVGCGRCGQGCRKGAGGGAGLHGSRGGTQAAQLAGRVARADGPRKRTARGDRPDYLVEDEETWISEEDRNRNVPRTIE